MKRGDLAGSVGLGAWTAFGVLTMAVIGDGQPLYGDEDLLSWSVAHRPDMAVALARGLTATGTGFIPYVLAVLAGILAGRTLRRRAVAAALCLACLGAGQAARYGVLALVARPRPTRVDWATHASGWAFPSGHTTAAFASATVLHRHFGWKVGLPAYGAATYVAASRVQGKRHYLSDVAFGAALGVVAGRTVTMPGGHKMSIGPIGTDFGPAAGFTLIGKK